MEEFTDMMISGKIATKNILIKSLHNIDSRIKILRNFNPFLNKTKY